MLRLFLKRWRAVLTLLLLTPTSHANEWVISGFITQGITYSSDYQYFGDSDDSIGSKFTELGINLKKQLSERILFTTQGAYRNSNAIDQKDFFLDILQLDAQLYSDHNSSAGIKLGRFKLNYGLYSGIIDVPAAWPTALISDVAFFNAYRSSLISMDGVELRWQREINHWSLTLSAQAGHEVLDEKVFEAYLLSPETRADYNHSEDYYTFRVNLFSPDNSLLLGWDYLNVSEDVNYKIPQQLINKTDQTYKEQRVYVQKTWNQWQIDAEYLRGKINVDAYQVHYPSGMQACQQLCQNNLDLFNTPNSITDTYIASYINLYYHYPNGVTVYGGYGVQYDYTGDKKGRDFQSATGLPANIAYMKQTLLGFKYDINNHWNIAAILSYFSGTANLEYFSNPPAQRNNNNWHALHINLSYIF